MTKCYLNGREYEISKEIIMDYINTDSRSINFTSEEKDKIANEVVSRMDSIVVKGADCQEYNFIEERYTDACLDYIVAHNNDIENLLNEENDCEIWDYLNK